MKDQWRSWFKARSHKTWAWNLYLIEGKAKKQRWCFHSGLVWLTGPAGGRTLLLPIRLVDVRPWQADGSSCHLSSLFSESPHPRTTSPVLLSHKQSDLKKTLEWVKSVWPSLGKGCDAFLQNFFGWSRRKGFKIKIAEGRLTDKEV